MANETKREKRDTKKVEAILEAYDQIGRNDYELAREILKKLGRIDIKTGKIQTSGSTNSFFYQSLTPVSVPLRCSSLAGTLSYLYV